jgi:hypothetical protein
MDTEETPTLEEVLRDLTYPAEKWEITTCAEIYGADLRTRRELYGLPARSYTDATDIAKALDR